MRARWRSSAICQWMDSDFPPLPGIGTRPQIGPTCHRASPSTAPRQSSSPGPPPCTVVDREQGHTAGGEGFHIHAGLAGAFGGGVAQRILTVVFFGVSYGLPEKYAAYRYAV